MRPEADQAAAVLRRLPLTGLADPVGAGREFARRAMAEWGWRSADGRPSPRLALDAALVVSELLTNAVLHGGGPVELVVGIRGQDALRIEVADGSAVRPEARPLDATPGGHGLRIVEKISDAWGVDAGADGKVVWSEIRG